MPKTVGVIDQEHLHVIIDSNVTIPDRTAFLRGGGADPRPGIIQSARTLEAAGYGLLVMPCNTAHSFAEDIVVQSRYRSRSRELGATGERGQLMAAKKKTTKKTTKKPPKKMKGMKM